MFPSGSGALADNSTGSSYILIPCPPIPKFGFKQLPKLPRKKEQLFVPITVIVFKNVIPRMQFILKCRLLTNSSFYGSVLEKVFLFWLLASVRL